MNKTVPYCAAATGVSLSFLYLLTLVGFARHLAISGLTVLEVGLLASQAVRVVGAGLYYRRRPVRLDVLAILFSLEAFAVSLLIGIAVASSSHYYSQLGQVVFSTWVASIFVVLPSYAILGAVREMARGQRLAGALIPVGLEFALLLLVTTDLLGSSTPFTFASFFDYLVLLHGVEVPALATTLLLVPSVAVYCALLVYAAAAGATSSSRARVVVLVPLASAAVSFFWVYAGALFLADSFLSLTLPGLVLVFALLVYMRR